MLLRVALFGLVVSIASSAFGQIVFEPVQYQYGDQNTFYYGGSDARILRYASGPASSAGTWGRVHGYDFVSANIDTHREVSAGSARVYTDSLGYLNARYYGFNANDAHNEANANTPTFFRMRDLLNAAVPSPTGGWVVPAQAQPIRLDPHARITLTPSARTVSGPRPLMIIPKKALEQDAKPPMKVAAN